MRKGLSLILSGNYKEIQIHEASEASFLTTLQSEKQPQAVMLGINTNSKKQCLEMVTGVKKQFPESVIIIYDDNQQMNMADSYLRLGISGYMLKQNISSELTDCLAAVMKGRYFLCSTLTQSLLSGLSQQGKTQHRKRKLTERETEIANYLSQGLGTSSIARRLNRKPSTISTIKNNVFKKLNVTNILELRKLILVSPT